MPILFQCRACKKKLSVGRKMSGASVHCPACNESIVVPSSTNVLSTLQTKAEAVPKLAPLRNRSLAIPLSLSFSFGALVCLLITLPIILIDQQTHQPAIVMHPSVLERPEQSMLDTTSLETTSKPEIVRESIKTDSDSLTPTSSSSDLSIAFSTNQEEGSNENGVLVASENSEPLKTEEFATTTPTSPFFDAPTNSVLPTEQIQRVEIKYREVANHDEDTLRDQFLSVPIVFYDQDFFEDMTAMRIESSSQEEFDCFRLIGKFPDLAGLPWILGPKAILDPSKGQSLRALALHLRTIAPVTFSVNERVQLAEHRKLKFAELEKLRSELLEGTQSIARLDPTFAAIYRSELAVPALEQLLMVEDRLMRILLVKALARIDHPTATLALARRAVFDFSKDVRNEAIQVLASRPEEQYADQLRHGLRYPSLEISMQAADAIAELKAKSLRPDLKQLLSESPPNRPFELKVDGTTRQFVREVVRVHHSSNCALCHRFDGFNSTPTLSAVVPSTPAEQVESLVRKFSKFPNADSPLLQATITWGVIC